MKAAAYLRVSGLAQAGEDRNGFDRQREAITRFAAERGFEIERFYHERGVSGTVEGERRPEFQTMLAELLSNGCRIIIVEDLSRLAREYDVQRQILTYLCAKEITLWTCANGGEDITKAMKSDPTSRLVIGIMGLVSEWEREQIEAKLRAARKRVREKNGRCEGRKPFGLDPKRPEEMPVWAEIEQMHRDHKSCAVIAAELNNRGIRPRYGSRWYAGTIRNRLDFHRRTISVTT